MYIPPGFTNRGRALAAEAGSARWPMGNFLRTMRLIELCQEMSKLELEGGESYPGRRIPCWFWVFGSEKDYGLVWLEG